MNHIDVIFRCCIGMKPQWQFYSLGVSVVGGSGTLADAKEAALEALEFELDGDEFTASFHTEMIGAEATDQRPAVWVRALQDADDIQRNRRREEQSHLMARMQAHPDLVDQTFDALPAATGDIVAIVGFESDTVQSVTRQTSAVGSVWLGVSDPQKVTWFGMDAGPREQNQAETKTLEGIGIDHSSTLGELVQATNDSESLRNPPKHLIAV